MTKPFVHDIIKKTGYICKGGGSAFGGSWKPKKPSDERFIGKPGEIKTSYVGGYKRETKIGSNGYAIKERHYSTAPNAKHHTNPHDHQITWENNHPNLSEAQNYWDGNVPEFKYYKRAENFKNNMNVANKFYSLNEAKESIFYGGELMFRYENKNYGITRLSSDCIILADEDGSNEIKFTSLEALLNHKIGDVKFRDLIISVELLYRNL